MTRLIVVSSGHRALTDLWPCQGRDLYGDPLFRRAIAWAEEEARRTGAGVAVYVPGAGLIEPDQLLRTPPDSTVGSSPARRLGETHRLIDEVRRTLQHRELLCIEVHGAAPVAEDWATAAQRWPGIVEVRHPVKGMNFNERLKIYGRAA